MTNLKKYQEFFDEVYEAGAIDVKTKNLIALGASLTAGCEP
jgi:alkylhydroperoxidase/carboxymuconolactone decarboxylase family protein YurZ